MSLPRFAHRVIDAVLAVHVVLAGMMRVTHIAVGINDSQPSIFSRHEFHRCETRD